MSVDQRLYYVGFSMVKGIGSVRVRNLIHYFGDLETAWNATDNDLREVGLGQKLLENLNQVRKQVSLEKEWENINNAGIKVFTWDDASYPERLREIDQSPPTIYCKGELSSDDDWSVGIVGTRRVTAYGKHVAAALAEDLARAGVTVVSGLARGIDSIAHQSSLRGGGRTIAVLGCGVDRIYPPENRQLAALITQNGAVVSDYAPGTPPDAVNFPPRNRLISALSRAVIIVEAGESSGALITAAFAAEQGREVFAVPGNINSPQSRGSHKLIQQGARLLQNTNDVLEVLNLTQLSAQKDARMALPSDPIEAGLYSLLREEPMPVDELKNRTDLPIEKVLSTLTLMELKGYVKKVDGINYSVVREIPEEYA